MDGQLDNQGEGGEDMPARRRLPSNERRQQIVDGAVMFFAEVGLDGKTRDLARRLGVTQSLIFNYFTSKDELIEAVYETVYIDRLSPDWPTRLTDRSQPLRSRLLSFYTEYSSLIFQHEWMRIFMFSGLAGAELNRRYLEHLSGVILHPLLAEIEVIVRFQEKRNRFSGSQTRQNKDLEHFHDSEKSENAPGRGKVQPVMEDIWNLHGGIVYIGIRRHIYQMPGPDDPSEAITRAVDRFLSFYNIGPED